MKNNRGDLQGKQNTTKVDIVQLDKKGSGYKSNSPKGGDLKKSIEYGQKPRNITEGIAGVNVHQGPQASSVLSEKIIIKKTENKMPVIDDEQNKDNKSDELSKLNPVSEAAFDWQGMELSDAEIIQGFKEEESADDHWSVGQDKQSQPDLNLVRGNLESAEPVLSTTEESQGIELPKQEIDSFNISEENLKLKAKLQRKIKNKLLELNPLKELLTKLKNDQAKLQGAIRTSGIRLTGKIDSLSGEIRATEDKKKTLQIEIDKIQKQINELERPTQETNNSNIKEKPAIEDVKEKLTINDPQENDLNINKKPDDNVLGEEGLFLNNEQDQTNETGRRTEQLSEFQVLAERQIGTKLTSDIAEIIIMETERLDKQIIDKDEAIAMAGLAWEKYLNMAKQEFSGKMNVRQFTEMVNDFVQRGGEFTVELSDNGPIFDIVAIREIVNNKQDEENRLNNIHNEVSDDYSHRQAA